VGGTGLWKGKEWGPRPTESKREAQRKRGGNTGNLELITSGRGRNHTKERKRHRKGGGPGWE